MTVNSLKQIDPDKRYTYAEYLTWQFDEMMELIRGKIFRMSPAPGSSHQEILGYLHLQIGGFLFERKCKTYTAPFDVRLPNKKGKTKDQEVDTVVQPDLCVVCDLTKIDRRGCIGAPDIVVEILSPSTTKKDLTEKFDIYENSEVQEYWIVHPNDQTVLVYSLNKKGKYQQLERPYTASDTIKSKAVPGLTVDLT